MISWKKDARATRARIFVMFSNRRERERERQRERAGGSRCFFFPSSCAVIAATLLKLWGRLRIARPKKEGYFKASLPGSKHIYIHEFLADIGSLKKNCSWRPAYSTQKCLQRMNVLDGSWDSSAIQKVCFVISPWTDRRDFRQHSKTPHKDAFYQCLCSTKSQETISHRIAPLLPWWTGEILHAASQAQGSRL